MSPVSYTVPRRDDRIIVLSEVAAPLRAASTTLVVSSFSQIIRCLKFRLQLERWPIGGGSSRRDACAFLTCGSLMPPFHSQVLRMQSIGFGPYHFSGGSQVGDMYRDWVQGN
jgi:hypothetical protein